MSQPESRRTLSEEELAEAQQAHSAVVEEFLGAQPPANVVGLAVGVKRRGGEFTGEPALVVLVTHKQAQIFLPAADRVPPTLGEIQTDVQVVGYPLALGTVLPPPGTQTLAQRVRPARGGYSVGHFQITAGTIATAVYDVIPGTPPHLPSFGIPPRYYLLSNNHVLANSNDGALGDPILQPGPIDGGSDPADRIATLSRYIPIDFDPPLPRDRHNNIVDAAIAEGEFQDLDREIYWIGYPQGWRDRASVELDLAVKKTGRTTNFSVGFVTAVNATVDVGYGGGRVARFSDQIVTSPISAPGDSGSLVLSLADNLAVGLLFAGSPSATILNQFENVYSLLQVEVAQ